MNDVLSHVSNFVHASDWVTYECPREGYYRMVGVLALLGCHDIPRYCTEYMRLCLRPVFVGHRSLGHGYGETVSVTMTSAGMLECGRELHPVAVGTRIYREWYTERLVMNSCVLDGSDVRICGRYTEDVECTTPGW